MAHGGENRKDLQHLIDPALYRCVRQDITTHLEVLRHAECGEDVSQLRNVAHPVANSRLWQGPRQIDPVQRQLPLEERQLTNYSLYEGALAGSVRANENNDLSLADLQTRTVDDLEWPVAETYPLGDQRRRGSAGGGAVICCRHQRPQSLLPNYLLLLLSV